MIDGVAEYLPFSNYRLDFAIMVTTICFVANAEMSIKEAYRVLKTGRHLIIGLIDKESLLGKLYRMNKDKCVFYKAAKFYSVGELLTLLGQAEFKDFRFTQTIFHYLSEIKETEPMREGHGEGSFVFIGAVK